MSEIYKTPIMQANKMLDFFGTKQGSEEADDILFALQVQYGDPKLDYEEALANYTTEDVQKAVDYVKKQGLNKHTYFQKKPQDSYSYDAYTMQNEPEDLEKLENEWGWK